MRMFNWINWPNEGLFKHEHSWRRMTGKEDYGNPRSRHWGRYTGSEQEICKGCGITRYVQGWQAWKYQLDDAERQVKYLKEIEPVSPQSPERKPT